MKVKVLLAGIIALVFVLTTASVAYIRNSLGEWGPNRLYYYKVEEGRDGGLRVIVGNKSRDADVWNQRREANNRRAVAIMESMFGTLIPVQVTLARPLSLAEAQALINDSGLQVEQYSWVIVTRNGHTHGRHYSYPPAIPLVDRCHRH